jgi:hypothetical protein
MKDEYGRTKHSEKLLNMVFSKLMRVANQFGNGIAAPELTSLASSASGR